MKDKFETKKGESEFDLRQSQLNSLGDFVEASNKAHYNFLRNKTVENAEELKSILRVIFFDVKSYSDLDDKKKLVKNQFENLDKRLDSYKRTHGSNAVLEGDVVQDSLEKLRESISDIRQDANLDIPRKTRVDPEDAALEGL